MVTRCIKIFHRPNDLLGYRWIAGFLRFCGIFVCENVYEKDTKGNEDVDWILLISPSNESKERYVKYVHSSILESLTEEDALNYINCMIDMVWGEHELEQDILKKIARIYTENELMSAAYVINYFFPFEECMKVSYDSFKKAYNSFVEEDASDEYGQSPYWIYAVTNCQRRMNELSKILEIEAPFHTRDILKQIDSIFQVDGGNYSAYTLKAFVDAADTEYELDAIYNYERCVSKIKDKMYASYNYYFMAKFYEKLGNFQKAFVYYSQSYKVNDTNYRAAYKLAEYWRKKGCIEESIEYYKKVIRILQLKKCEEYTQPIEYAYLYKANRDMGLIYLWKLGNYSDSITKLEEARSVYDKIDGGNKFYKQIFKDKAEEYLEFTRKKLDIASLYSNLSDAYFKYGNVEDSFKYKNKLSGVKELGAYGNNR